VADKAAKEATNLQGAYRPVSMNCARTVVKMNIRDGDPDCPWLKEVYGHFSKSRKKSIKTRCDQVNLARIRYGKHLAFAVYDHMLPNEVETKCPRCDHPQHYLKHWLLECPGTRDDRYEIFGEEADDSLGLLTKRPEQAVTLARITLLGA